ncbi:MAG: hypothetical protein ACLUNQ_07910 [Oscillospiraceae bacterium]
MSNHHLGTQLGMLMAAYEMNQFRDVYQKAVIDNAKSFARSLKAHGLDVAGDPAIGYTETHQVIVSVGYGEGPDIAERLERNNIVVNYQATPDEEGFTASGALRMGVSEMTRFGFEAADFDRLAGLMADCILRGTGGEGGSEEAAQRASGDALLLQRCRDRRGAGAAGRQAGVRRLLATITEHPAPDGAGAENTTRHIYLMEVKYHVVSC